VIRLEGIQRVFQVGDETVYGLRQVDLSIATGAYLSIMGPSGSGKSTLLNIMGLLDRPDQGTYYLDEMDTTRLSDNQQAEVRRNRIGFIFQFFHLVPRLTAAENVELPMTLAGIPPVQRKEAVLRTLEQLGLADRANHRPDQLSGGQRQRVAIARATIMHPKVILADEPTGNLDRASGTEVIKTIELLHQHGMTVVMVTHDPELGKRASRQIAMVDGTILQDQGRVL
jgi:putative ABC transport system ATP-binding protein